MPAITRVLLAYLLLTGLVIGIWACGFPSSFYDSFPGFGRVWVSVDGPFNQHLVRDTGAAALMMGAIAGLGLFRPQLAAPFAVGFATMFFNLPHFTYHMTHLGMYGPLDQVLIFGALGSTLLSSAWLMLPRSQLRR